MYDMGHWHTSAALIRVDRDWPSRLGELVVQYSKCHAVVVAVAECIADS